MKIGVFADWRIPRPGTPYDLAAWHMDMELLAQCRVSDVALGLSAHHLREPRRRDVIDAARVAWSYGIAPWLMLWLHRNERLLRVRLPLLRGLTSGCQARGPILDAEESWYRGPTEPERAAWIVAEELEGTDWTVTGILRVHLSLRPLVRLARRGIVQTYSIYHPSDEEHWSRAPRMVADLKPPRCQELGFQSWGLVLGDTAELELGWAAYWLARPGMQREAVLTDQLLAAEHLGVERSWGWSLKHLRAARWAQAVLRGR